MRKTAIGLFENRISAEKVVRELEVGGLPAGKIRILGEPQLVKSLGAMSAGQSQFEVDSARELERVGATRLEVEAYLNGLRRGGMLLIATSSGNESDVIAQIMNRGGAFDVEELMARNRISSAWYSRDDAFPRWV